MFARLVAWLGKVAVVLLAGVGLLAVVIVWKLAGWLNGDQAKGPEAVELVRPAAVQVVRQAEPVQQEAEPVPVGLECWCRNGVYCTGPKGGEFCMSDDYKKKYRGQR